jgi:TrmH family RNA methyltransferase
MRLPRIESKRSPHFLMPVLHSKDNPRVRRWAKLARDAHLRRGERCALIEGTHLVSAWLDRHGAPPVLIASETGLDKPEIAELVRRCGLQPVTLDDRLFRTIVDVESPAGIAAEIRIPSSAAALESSRLCVFLEGIQDAGNVGAILRSAAAFGAQDAVLSRGCADAWSPKALRAGMGGQFVLNVVEHADLEKEIANFGGLTLCTAPLGGVRLDEIELGGRIGWIFGAEGRGVGERLAARAGARVTIPMPGAIESLNVAAAAAICLYETARRRGRGTGG